MRATVLPQLIHKDRHILVIDKPAGMPSVAVPGGTEATLARWLVGEFPKQKKFGEDEAGLVHRLDNDTSGVIVAARTEEAHEFLKSLWEKNKVLKEYDCLVLGQTPAEGKITKLIAHHPNKSNKMTVVDNASDAKKSKARFAGTEYHTIEYFLDYTYLKVRITTGARHQIRCHLSSIGHPVAGDKFYQRTKHTHRDWLNLPRHFLHASKIGFTHPSSGKYVEYASPLPKDLEAALEQLR